MFKALVIAYYFPPMGLSGVQRTLKFSKYMSKFNWEPTVITGSGSSYFAYDMSLLKEAEVSNINIIRTEPFDANSILVKRSKYENFKEEIKNGINSITKNIIIPDNKVFWANRAYKKAAELMKNENFDVIYVSCPPFSAFTIATKLKEEFDVPLFVDYRDLWHHKESTQKLSPYHRVKNNQLEDNALRSADKIIVVNRKIKEKLITNYPFLTFDDVMILSNGYDVNDFEDAVPFDRKNDDKMRITYSGIFNDMSSPKYFLEAFKRLTIERPDITKNIELHFVGALRKTNIKLIKSLELDAFVIDHGKVDHKESVRYVISSDILWMMVSNVKDAFTVTGGKLYEYFGSKKPIIACVPEGAASIAAEDYGAAFVVKPDDVEKIKEAILKSYQLFKDDKLPKPNIDFIKDLSREELTKKLTKEFQFFIKEDVI